MNLENKKQIAIVLLAIGLGLVAAILTGSHIQNSIKLETAKLSKHYENKKIKPLMRDIAALRKEVKKLASRQVSSKSIKSGESKKSPKLPKTSLALRTPAGKRAYTVRIDSLSAVGGLISPGDYVDVIAHMNMRDPVTKKKQKITSMIFQNILILAVGTNLQAPGGYAKQAKARSLKLTFALTPEEAGLMSFVQRKGKMQLVLRAPAETEVQLMQTSGWRTLADYVFEKQGTELVIPRGRAVVEPLSPSKTEPIKPFIEIYSGGREL